MVPRKSPSRCRRLRAFDIYLEKPAAVGSDYGDEGFMDQ